MAAHSGDLLSHYVAYLRYCTASDRTFLLEKSEPGPAVARKGRRPTGGRGMYRVQLLLIVPDCSNVLQSPRPQDNRRETAYHQNIPYIALLAYLSTYLHSTVRMDRSTVSSAQLPSIPYAQCAPPPRARACCHSARRQRANRPSPRQEPSDGLLRLGRCPGRVGEGPSPRPCTTAAMHESNRIDCTDSVTQAALNTVRSV